MTAEDDDDTVGTLVQATTYALNARPQTKPTVRLFIFIAFPKEALTWSSKPRLPWV